MALPTFDKKADIPKGFEEEYEEKDGKWVPVDRTARAEKALEAERERREAAETVSRKATRDLADAQLKAQAAAAGMTEAEQKKVYAQIEENIRAEYKPKLEAADKLTAENRTLKLTNVVKTYLRAQGALANRLDDFWTLHGAEFDLTSDGKPMVKAEPGKDVVKHVAAIIKQRPEWVQGTRAAGGGAGGTTTTQTLPGSGEGGALTFDDVMKNPALGIAKANEG